jgi:pyruvate dehydrogenase E2 component (dihydrolipoyllysine-residue acetyltransferase)
MISEVVMPQMGADMKEGTILKWIKNEGDQVARGEIIAEIETDKANVEIEAFDGGVFRKAVHQEGEVVPVGTIIAVIAGPEDDISQYTSAAPPAAEPASPQTGAATETQAAAPSSAPEPSTPVSQPPQAPARSALASAPAIAAPPSDGRMRASPVARRLAEEMGVDLATVKGSGPDGRILRRDVETAPRATAPAAAPAGAPVAAPAAPIFRPAPLGEDVVEDVPLNRIRQAVARRTQESKQQAPHYYLGAEVDMTEAAALRVSLNKSLGDEGRLTLNDIIILATAKALVQHPKFNAFWVQDHVQRHSRVNIGIAVAMEDGLVAPAIIDVANKGLLQISREARDVASRARSGNLTPDEYTAGTFNISNIGGYGIEEIIAIITPPQVGVLSVGIAKEKPVVRDGEIVVRNVMMAYLAADHRATDGADGARFLATVRQYLENPGMLLL